MADKEKDLQIHIGADIDDFLADLQLMDKAYQECVTDIENKKAEVRLQTSVDISAARAAGDKIAEIVARNREQNDLLKLQTEKVNFLKKGWQEVAKAQGESSEKAKKAYAAYQKAQIVLNNMTERNNRGGVMKNLSFIAPDTFRKIEQVKNAIAAVSAEYPSIAKFAPALGTMATGFVAAGAAAAGVYTALVKIRDSAVESAKEAMAAGDALYYLKERLSVNDADATFLQGVFKLDGTDVQGILGAIQKLDKALLSANEDGTKASQAMARYGESLVNADGSLKNAREQLEAISRAYEKASAEGKGFQFLTETGMGKFSSTIAGFSGYAERVKEVVRPLNESADKAHAMSDAMSDLKLQTEQVGKVWGNALLDPMKEALKYEQQLKANQVNFENVHADELQKSAVWAGELYKRFSNLEAIIGRIKSKGLMAFDGFADSSIGKVLIATGEKLTKWAAEKLDLQLNFDIPNSVADFKKAQDTIQKTAKENPIKQEISVEVKKANDKLDKALRDAKASDYQKELYRLQDEVAEYQKAGADKLKIEEYYQTEKAKIDEKYASKRNSEQEQLRKEAESRVQAAKQASEQIQQVFMTETQRRIAEIEKQKEAWIRAGASEVEATRAAERQKAEARMSEAERTLRENVKLVRKMQQEEAKGGNWQQRVMDWQDNQYMKKNGFKPSDISALQKFGTDLVNQLANARDRVFSGFGGSGGNATTNNTVNNTVNIDRPVVTDESFLNQLVDRVCDKLVPVMKQAYGGQQNSY